MTKYLINKESKKKNHTPKQRKTVILNLISVSKKIKLQHMKQELAELENQIHKAKIILGDFSTILTFLCLITTNSISHKI
jgi:hypothetical protein